MTGGDLLQRALEPGVGLDAIRPAGLDVRSDAAPSAPVPVVAREPGGTPSGDVFHLDLNADQAMYVDGGTGDDTISIRPGGTVTVAYYFAERGVAVYLGAGEATDAFGHSAPLILANQAQSKARYSGTRSPAAATTRRLPGVAETTSSTAAADSIPCASAATRNMTVSRRAWARARSAARGADAPSPTPSATLRGWKAAMTTTPCFSGPGDERVRGRRGDDLFVVGAGTGNDTVEDCRNGANTITLYELGNHQGRSDERRVRHRRRSPGRPDRARGARSPS